MKFPMKTYRASQIADWILCNIDREAGDSITHLKLQKLLYYIQAWALVFSGRPLFEEPIQAWAHGPVVEAIFHKYKDYGWEAIGAPEEVPDIDDLAEQHIKSILAAYGDYTAKNLELMTHRETPWIAARGSLPPEARSSAQISHESMIEYYKEILEAE